MTDSTDNARGPERSDAYLIVKRDLYYGPNSQGYTGVKDRAGRYTLAEVATRFPNRESPNQDGMYYIHEDDAPEYSKGCYWDVRLEHQRDKALAEVARLSELEPTPQDDPRVLALVKAAKEMVSAFYSNGNVTERHLRACKAGVSLDAALAAFDTTDKGGKDDA